MGPPASPKPNAPNDVNQPSEYEMAVIKSRYLGQKDPDKKQRVKRDPNSKKMNFDWAATDDTTAHEQGSWRMDVKANAPGAVMLGGRLAGFDEGGSRRGQTAVEDQYVNTSHLDNKVYMIDMPTPLSVEEQEKEITMIDIGPTSRWKR
jgi:ATP-dependent RNA helicase DDX23/PRP28